MMSFMRMLPPPKWFSIYAKSGCHYVVVDGSRKRGEIWSTFFIGAKNEGKGFFLLLFTMICILDATMRTQAFIGFFEIPISPAPGFSRGFSVSFLRHCPREITMLFLQFLCPNSDPSVFLFYTQKMH